MNINDLIESDALVTYMQPLCCINKQSILGVEALTRGIDNNNDIIPPNILFGEASKNIDTLIKLDSHCRNIALKRFKKLKNIYDNLILFLNIESSTISGADKAQNLMDAVNELGLSPSEIVLEINESKSTDIKSLINLCNKYKEYGFLIALDDVGSGFSNLNRIPLLSPNIIKVDRFLIQNINEDYCKQEVLKSLVNLATSIGALVVAEGVETTREAITVIEFGADIIQGFLLSKPVPTLDVVTQKMMKDLQRLALSFKDHIYQINNQRKGMIDELSRTTSNIVIMLSDNIISNLDMMLDKIASYENNIECIYILDKRGYQISDTVFNILYKNKSTNVLYSPSKNGADHSSKRYYFQLVNSTQVQHISDKYISMATGNVCYTVSELFIDKNGYEYIVCIDFLAIETKINMFSQHI